MLQVTGLELANQKNGVMQYGISPSTFVLTKLSGGGVISKALTKKHLMLAHNSPNKDGN